MKKSMLALATAGTIGLATVMTPTPASAWVPALFVVIYAKLQSQPKVAAPPLMVPSKPVARKKRAR
jgi:hypothetical protein